VKFPWKTKPPAATQIEPPDDAMLTLDKWPKAAFDWHYHACFNWLLPIKQGWMVVQIGEERLTIHPQNWILIFPFVPHIVLDFSDDVEVLSLFVSQEAMLEAHQTLGVGQLKDVRYFTGGSSPIAQGFGLHWAELKVAPDSDSELSRRMNGLLSVWLWKWYVSGWRPEENAYSKLQKLDNQKGELRALFESHLASHPFPWEAVAKILGKSTRSSQRHLKITLGITPSQLLIEYRLQRAAELLEESSLELVDIALRCGFSSQSHFSTTFGIAYGVTPRQYRLQHRR